MVPMNHWDNANCHPDLSIDGSQVVERHEKTGGYVSVRAKLMLPRQCQKISYYEMTIVKKCWDLMVGLAPLSLKTTLATKFEDFADCYFYESDGGFFGHNVEGCKYFYDGNVMPYLCGKPKFGSGDVIGCGVNLATGQIIYTKNGERLATYKLFISKSDALYPFVASWSIGDKVEANFGQRPFAYDLSKELMMRGTRK